MRSRGRFSGKYSENVETKDLSPFNNYLEYRNQNSPSKNIGLTSGKAISVTKVKLYKSSILERINKIQVKREELSQKVNETPLDGFGLWGSIGFVAVGSILLDSARQSIINSQLSDAIHEDIGYDTEESKLFVELEETAKFFDVRDVLNIDSVNVDYWTSFTNEDNQDSLFSIYKDQSLYRNAQNGMVSIVDDQGKEYCLKVSAIEYVEV